MPRILWLPLGLILALLPFVDAKIRSKDLSRSDLAVARGGDPGYGTSKVSCDLESGVYIGCKKVGDFCRQCVTRNADGSYSPNMADALDTEAPKNATGYMHGQTFQDCGTYSDGMCVIDANNPAGFACDGADTLNSCTEGIQSVFPQLIVGPGRGGPGGLSSNP